MTLIHRYRNECIRASGTFEAHAQRSAFSVLKFNYNRFGESAMRADRVQV